jgi:hypothetical protein
LSRRRRSACQTTPCRGLNNAASSKSVPAMTVIMPEIDTSNQSAT